MTTLRDCAVEVAASALYEEPYTHCEQCNGIGQVADANFWCSACKGEGSIVDEDEVTASRDFATTTAETALDALLAATTTTACAMCGATGSVAPSPEEKFWANDICATCDGTGTVSAGPLLVGLLVEAGVLEVFAEVGLDPKPLFRLVSQTPETTK